MSFVNIDCRNGQLDAIVTNARFVTLLTSSLMEVVQKFELGL